jgi:hypothetical protein
MLLSCKRVVTNERKKLEREKLAVENGRKRNVAHLRDLIG